MSSFSLFIGVMIEDSIKWASQKDKATTILLTIVISQIVFFAAFLLFEYYYTDRQQIWASAYFSLSVFITSISFLLLTGLISDFRKDLANITGRRLAIVVLLVVACATVVGKAFGVSVRDAKGVSQQITIRDRTNKESIFENAKIVMILSHHIIFNHDGRVYTFPSADVTQITSGKR